MGLPLNLIVLRERRREKHWNQHDLARAAGVDPSVVNRIERDVQDDITLGVLLSIVRALDLTVNDLLMPPDRRVALPAQDISAELADEIRAIAVLPANYQHHAARLLAEYRAALAALLPHSLT